MTKDFLIRDRRKELGLSQAALGKLIGVSQQHVNRFEQGHPIPLNKMPLIAQVLKLDEKDLFNLLPAHISGVQTIAEKIAPLFARGDKDNVTIDIIDATACCGDGIENLPEKVCGHWKLPLNEFKSITAGNPDNIKMLRVQGDSMQPTINEGDWVWVDISNNYVSSDGIYLLAWRLV